MDVVCKNSCVARRCHLENWLVIILQVHVVVIRPEEAVIGAWSEAVPVMVCCNAWSEAGSHYGVL